MDRWAISDDVGFHTMLVGICRLKMGDEELRKFIDDGIKGVNAGDVEASTCGGAGDTGRHNFEVVDTDEALVGHVDGKLIGSQEGGTKGMLCGICHMKYLSERVGLAEQEGYVAFAPSFD